MIVLKDGIRVAVMVTRIYFGFIIATISGAKRRFWLNMLIGVHYFRVNSCMNQKYLLLLSPS